MKAADTIRALRAGLDSLIIIHYSCEGLDDTNEGLSPRITSIAALHVGSMTMHSFSIHLVAEIEKIPKDQIDGKYDILEARMLDDFFAFASTRSDCNWLHWKMSNINFGVETLEHRFRVHHPDNLPYKINDSKKYNLSSLILAIYGERCVDHPHMPNLMELNGGKNRDVLSGKEEVEAFKAKEYVKLHKSTMSKVYWFKKIFFLLAKRKVITSHSNLPARINDISESWIFKLAGIVAMAFAFFQIGETSLKYLGQKQPSNNPLEVVWLFWTGPIVNL